MQILPYRVRGKRIQETQTVVSIHCALVSMNFLYPCFVSTFVPSLLRCLTVPPCSLTNLLSSSVCILNASIPQIKHKSCSLLILQTLPQSSHFLPWFYLSLSVDNFYKALFLGACFYLLIRNLHLDVL